MQVLEEEPGNLGEGGAKQVCAAGQESRKWGGGIVFRCVTPGLGFKRGWSCLFKPEMGRKLSFPLGGNWRW